MSDRWRLFEEDFYFEVVSEQEAINYRSYEKSTPLLKCTGRGGRKLKLRLEDLRLPDALKQELQQQQKAAQPKVGKGRARLLTDKRMNTEHIPGRHGCQKVELFHSSLDIQDKSKDSSGFQSNLQKSSSPILSSSPISYLLSEPFGHSANQGFRPFIKEDVSPKFTDEDFPEISATQKPLPEKQQTTLPKSEGKKKSSQKQSKKKKKGVKNEDKGNLTETSGKNNDYSMEGNHVCRIEGLATELSLKDFRDFLTNFGQVVDVKLSQRENDSVVIVKLGTAESTEYLMECLDGSDTIFPGSEQPVKCTKLS